MKLFIAYAHEQHDIAAEVNASLHARGLDVFFDRSDLLPGHEYNARIKVEVESRDILIFLVSPESIGANSYAMTELAHRQRKYPNPSGTMLPVMVRATLLKEIDPYLRAVTILYPVGNVAAEVSAAVDALTPPAAGAGATGAAMDYRAPTETLYRERIAAYRPLWEFTRLLPKWPKATDVRYENLHKLSEDFRDWYFGGGGLFLSSEAHTAYAGIQNALAAILRGGTSGLVDDDHYEAVRELCSALRTQLAVDIGSRNT